MKANDAFLTAMGMTDYCMLTYLKDFSDADLFLRPGKGCNHLAWQLGHLINSEQHLINKVRPGSGIELPSGFGEKHGKDKVSIDDSKQFYTKAEYVDLYKKSRESAKKLIAGMTEQELDQPSPKGFEQFPTMGSIANLIANHPMMHVGQFVVVRRSLGKPVVI